MPGNPRDMIVSAERRFPVRIRIGVPPDGFGRRYAEMTSWLDETCGADGWAMTPSGMRGVLNDAVSIYFLEPPSRAPSLRGGVPVTKSRRRRACSGYGRMSRPRGPQRACTEPVIQKKPRPAFGERSLRGGSEVTGREAMAVAVGAEDPAVIVELPYSASGMTRG